MQLSSRYLLLFSFLFGSISIFYIIVILILQITWVQLIQDWTFILTIISYLFAIEEFHKWVKNGKRSEMSDIVAIFFFFFLIFFFSKDILTSLMGAFSIYLWIGIFELKEYPVLNKILIISLVTYNIIFITGIISFNLDDPIYVNTSFAFSFWIILILGFILFGRKYLIVWRFLSPEYLTLFIYIIAWLAIVLINQYTPFNLITTSPFSSNNFKFIDLFLNIYFALIFVNWLIYFISGPILDKLLGIEKAENSTLIKIVNEVKSKIGIKSKVKIGFGKYPILNAMAYGSFFDKRIAIIAEDLNEIPEDELKGIVAHELAHTKGKHTLILTIITSGDLLVRMLLGIPATYYDYTFGNPPIPLFLFILLNLCIYVILFIFVRILEGRADLKTKISGYGNELVKALYNLESYYASGREIGLNTMLLCDEKISKNNQLLDYLNTASYLNHSMIKPSKASLLGTFLNSHPPSYFRIAAILSNELKPTKEAILPFICLKKSKQRKYAKIFEDSRQAFKIIANEKFKELFQIEDVSLLLNDLKRKETYKYDINKDFLFTNNITNKRIFGHINEIEFLDDVSDSDQFNVTNLKTHELESLKSSLYSRTQIDLNEKYYLQKNSPLILKDIAFDDKMENGNYVFFDQNNHQIDKSILKTKLPYSEAFLANLEKKVIFFKYKGKLDVQECVEVSKATNLEEYELILSNFNNINKREKELRKYTLKELIIRPRRIFLPISKNISFRNSEASVINWLKKNQLLIYLYLKKPVNNLEIGYIQRLTMDLNDLKKKSKTDENKNENSIVLKNIFREEVEIPYNKIESIGFEYSSALIQIRSATSISSRLGYKILKKFKPEKIIIT